MSMALAMFEAPFPRSELVVMKHLPGHLAQQLKEFGYFRVRGCSVWRASWDSSKWLSEIGQVS